jgi:hypothetical protein
VGAGSVAQGPETKFATIGTEPFRGVASNRISGRTK